MLRKLALTGGRAIYVLPLRATVTEKVDELKALLRGYNQARNTEYHHNTSSHVISLRREKINEVSKAVKTNTLKPDTRKAEGVREMKGIWVVG